MTQEREDELKLTMFPLLLQAVYNAQFYINKKTEGKEWRFVENTEHNEVGEAFRQMDDLRLILRAFASVGIFPRCPMETETNVVAEARLYKMRHFSEMEKDHVLELFNPDKSDFENFKEKYEDEFKKKESELLGKIEELESEVHKWKSIAGGDKGEIRRDFCVKHNQAISTLLNALGNREALETVKNLPNNTTIEGFRRDAYVVKSLIADGLMKANKMKNALNCKLNAEAFDVLADKKKASSETENV